MTIFVIGQRCYKLLIFNFVIIYLFANFSIFAYFFMCNLLFLNNQAIV